MENNSCVLCLENVNNTKYIEYTHCGKYYLHLKCYDELICNFRNQCIICRKKVKLNYKNNILEIEENDENSENVIEIDSEIDEIENNNNNNNNNFIRCSKLCFVSIIVVSNFYILSYLLYTIY